MNPYITRLQPYPFERLATLIDGIEPAPGKAPIPLFIGEPRHPPPAFIIVRARGGSSRIVISLPG